MCYPMTSSKNPQSKDVCDLMFESKRGEVEISLQNTNKAFNNALMQNEETTNLNEAIFNLNEEIENQAIVRGEC
jgi:hypothetical protein